MTSLVPGLAVVAVLGLAACNGPVTAPGGQSPTRAAGADASRAAQTPAASTTTTPAMDWVTTPAADASDVPVDTRVVARAEEGTLTAASLRYTNKKGQRVDVKGWLESGTWTASDLLEPGATYTLAMEGTDASGAPTRTERTFTTAPLTLDDQIYVKVVPDGQTVGIGMPVIVTFDLPVVDKATFEKHMVVTSTPAQEGSWYWLSSREAHWRPKAYWKPGTKVHVEANLNGVPAGGNRFGEQSRVADFTVGRSVVAKVDLKSHLMDVYVSGAKARTIPISGGRPGWETRSGVKVIMEKYTNFEMKAESIGLKPGDKDYYHDVTVKHALRITHSGEFLHTATWSVSQQGRANVSHGCTGMSEASSDWVFANMRIGDVVETTGSRKPMTMGNGYADWNLSWAAYQKGSAL
ncbi:MAG TPA: Ig-like domain-containing protein [Intrasporangium sp.]|uniref:L,D-transpeptidase n=1 Tax=Intrasporangium sp. TaxID=1925024 RepID=UPI002D7A278A|nr:Ig-like domain-containing protein [Intrasporangium sp.]HET7397760.1 Ig-like domain-containing protein [Intrasporangium sp.]